MSAEATKSKSQKDGEASVEAFRHALGPFVVAAQKTRMPMIFLNANDGNAIVFANDSFLKLIGYTREEIMVADFRSLLADGVDDENLHVLDAAFRSEHCIDPEVHYRRKDGSEFWASMFITPVCDRAGKVVQYFASFADLTAHRLENRRSNALIAELNHRVKNTLATVQFIVSHALRDPAVPSKIRLAIESRIQALSRSHDLLTETKWCGVGLHDLVNRSLDPFHAASNSVDRITIAGSNLLLPPKTSLAIAIALNELATNSVKYGALSDEVGTVTVDWETVHNTSGDRLIIQWQERNGPVVAPPTHKGFGTWVLGRGISHELDGTVSLDYHSHGVSCLIDIPDPAFIRSIE